MIIVVIATSLMRLLVAVTLTTRELSTPLLVEVASEVGSAYWASFERADKLIVYADIDL